jgi:photosynthetic reaction center H subunit
MGTGAITSYIDVAQLTLYTFFAFFAGLVFYLRREDKREGYPLDTNLGPDHPVTGFPGIPKPKTFLLRTGEVVLSPRPDSGIEVVTNATRADRSPGTPIDPIGNKLLSGVGPASFAKRADVPDASFPDGSPRIVPLRSDALLGLSMFDADPRGFAVVGVDGAIAGHVSDVWVDKSESQTRYLEIALVAELGARHVLAPTTMVDIKGKEGKIVVRALLGAQFADVPGLKNPETITLLEEDMIMAYYGAGNLYATPARMEPLI